MDAHRLAEIVAEMEAKPYPVRTIVLDINGNVLGEQSWLVSSVPGVAAKQIEVPVDDGKRRRRTPEEAEPLKQEMIRLHHTGMSNRDIALRLDVATQWVYLVVKPFRGAAKAAASEKPKPMKRRSGSKTKAIRKQVMELHEQGCKVTEIADIVEAQWCWVRRVILEETSGEMTPSKRKEAERKERDRRIFELAEKGKMPTEIAATIGTITAARVCQILNGTR